MSKARLLAPWAGEERRSALYHCVSRVVDRKFIFGDDEREEFVSIMRNYEAFCGVRILSYCVMSNHFHLLIEVPPRMDDSVSDEELLRRLALINKDEYVAKVRQHLMTLAESETRNGKKAHAELRDKYLRRMWDLGAFMKALKQRFSAWYNKRHGRLGTLWECRYQSALVENGHAARTVSAYIDLNPIRAKMVNDPKEYRWCSYAAAVAGGSEGKMARRGLGSVWLETLKPHFSKG